VARIDTLNDLMKDLLLFARPPQPRLAPTDPRPILETVVNLVRQDPGAREIAIQVRERPTPSWRTRSSSSS
jgi:signal transduction histidine kinase